MKDGLALVFCAGLGLAGCVEPQPVPEPVSDPTDLCGASELQGLVGQPGEVLTRMRFAKEVRVIRYGMAVTMDYSAERLNIWLDKSEVIERVTCG